MSRPTGIIRTLPSLYVKGENVGRDNYERSMNLLEANRLPAVYIAMPAVPKFDVLYIYLLIDGRIDIRMNIAGYEPGGENGPIKCWDETIRQPRFWATCTGPVVRPPHELKMRGFQGFRYTEDLW